MRVDSPSEFLDRNGIAFKKSGSELVTDCPKCGKEGHLYLNVKTFLWHCKRCGEKGNEVSFKKALGLQYDVQGPTGVDPEKEAVQRMINDMKAVKKATDVDRWCEALLQNPEAKQAREYLMERGFSLDDMKRYKLGWAMDARGSTVPRRRRRGPVEPEEAGPGWVVVPSFTKMNKDGTPNVDSAAVVKLRSVPPAERQFVRLAGGESVLFAPHGIDPTQTVLVVGGELDALSCAVAGFTNVVATSLGEGNWNDAWTIQLQAVEDIVIIYDNDDAGRKGATALAEKLGSHRVRIGQWPDAVKDANEGLQKYGDTFAVQACVDAAKPAGGDAVVRVNDLRSEYLEMMLNGTPRGVSTGWPDLDNLIAGVRKGEVTTITGDTGSGKSTFASHLMLNLAAQGHKTLVCPFELGPMRQLDKWVRQWSRMPPDTLKQNELGLTLDELQGLPLWILKRYGAIKMEALRNTMMYAIKRLEVEMVLIDHLHFIVTAGPGERAEIEGFTKMFASVAVETGAHIFVVAHPRQHSSSDEKHRDNRKIQMSDIKGAASIKQDSDNILSVWRPRKDDRDDAVQNGYGLASIYSMKQRSDYAQEGGVSFRYHVDSARYEAQVTGSTLASLGPQTVALPRTRRQAIGPAAPPTPKQKQPHWSEVYDD